MKRWIPWVATAIVVALVGAGVARALAARQAQQKALAASVEQRATATLRIAAEEWVKVQARTLPQIVQVSGALRATDTAVIKARVAGELQGLKVREGDAVRAGQEVARIDPTESQARWRQAKEQADAAKAQVEINQRQFDNNRALVDQGFISPTALQTSQQALEGARSSYQAAVAATEVARKALEDTVLRSPINGHVSQRLAQPGERMPVDGRVLEVVDLTRLELEAFLNPAETLGVKVGQKAQLRVEGSTESVSATVVRISPAAQAGSRTVPVYLQVERAAGSKAAQLRQGIFVQGDLDTGSADVLALPLEAVRTDKPAPYVQTVKDGRVVHAPVTTGLRAVEQGVVWVAVQGLPAGTPVIAGRIGMLREGTLVESSQAQTPATPASGS